VDKILEEVLDRLNKLESKIEDKKENTNVSQLKKLSGEIPVNTMEYMGRYMSDATGSTFGANNIPIERLFNYSSFEMAKVIDDFSSEDRINIIKLLIKNRLTAKQLMEILKFPTTGKLYYNLSFLEKIGVIKKDGEQYCVSAKYISCVLLIFAGVEKIVKNL